MAHSKRLLRISFPLAILIACAFLWTNIATNSALLDSMPGAVGPGGWPRAMLLGLAIFAFLLLLSELNEWRLTSPSPANAPDDSSESGSTPLALLGVAVILIYGFSIQYLGFALATFLFLIVWCVLGRVRNPVTIGLISTIGTVVLLYMFVALAKMPLNRGVAPINEWTIALYQLLRIY